MDFYHHLPQGKSWVFVGILLSMSPCGAADVENTNVAHTRITRHVANNGFDSPGCGSRGRPCRSISQGIVNSAAGDHVSVGPGLYGDLDGDCRFDIPREGEEFGTSLCGVETSICLNKAVTVASVDGAEATVVNACGPSFGVVVLASDATFGRPHRGFTVINFSSNAVAVAAPSSVTVAGNIASAPEPGTGCDGCNGFVINQGTDHRLVGNLARDVDAGFITFSTGRLRMTDNVAVNNSSVGFRIGDQDALVARNVAIGNLSGFVVSGSGLTLRGNSVIGNRTYGIFLVGAATRDVVINRNNIFGNNEVAQDGNVNCGILNETALVVDATNNFWGSSTGPGVNPADEACDMGGGQIIHTPFARKQFRLRQKGNSSKSRPEDAAKVDDRAQ